MKVGRVDIVAEVEIATYAESSDTGIDQVAVAEDVRLSVVGLVELRRNAVRVYKCSVGQRIRGEARKSICSLSFRRKISRTIVNPCLDVLNSRMNCMLRNRQGGSCWITV